MSNRSCFVLFRTSCFLGITIRARTFPSGGTFAVSRRDSLKVGLAVKRRKSADTDVACFVVVRLEGWVCGV